MADFRVGIMGAGSIARKFCDAVSKTEGAVAAAVASKDLERAKAFAEENGILSYYDSYEQMLEQEKPDMVYIGTVIGSHYELVMLCLKHNTPVLCEKAMVRSADEAEEIFRLSEEKHVFVMEAMWSRFLPKTQKALEWIREGRIGDLKAALGTLGFCPPRDPENRYFSPELGGGAMYDIGVYAIEITQYLMGEPVTEVKTMMSCEEMQVDVMDQVLLRFPRGMAALHFTFSAMTGDKLLLAGTKGRIEMPLPHYGQECILYEGTEETERFCGGEENGFVYELRETMRCIREGLIESPVVPHKDTLDCVHIYEKIWQDYQDCQ